jgi:hypothetical protein
LLDNDGELYDMATSYFLNKIEFVSGHRVLAQILTVYKEDSEDTVKIKRAFRNFAKWFL